MSDLIHLRAITQSNYREIVKLRVAPEQENLVAPNLYTLAQTQFKLGKTALGIYLEDVPVGLVAYDLDDYDIWRLMIDHHYQGRGYGRQAMQRVMEILKAHGKLNEIRTSAIIAHNGPKSFYEKLGFHENGEKFEHENGDIEVTLIYSI
jgi:diamine N-acetyltransferase